MSSEPLIVAMAAAAIVPYSKQEIYDHFITKLVEMGCDINEMTSSVNFDQWFEWLGTSADECAQIMDFFNENIKNLAEQSTEVASPLHISYSPAIVPMPALNMSSSSSNIPMPYVSAELRRSGFYPDIDTVINLDDEDEELMIIPTPRNAPVPVSSTSTTTTTTTTTTVSSSSSSSTLPETNVYIEEPLPEKPVVTVEDDDVNMDGLEEPKEYICPITFEVMAEPVITVDGQTYSRDGIQTWFNNGNRTSPMTGAKLSSVNLVCNYALRTSIERFTTAKVREIAKRKAVLISKLQTIATANWEERCKAITQRNQDAKAVFAEKDKLTAQLSLNARRKELLADLRQKHLQAAQKKSVSSSSSSSSSVVMSSSSSSSLALVNYPAEKVSKTHKYPTRSKKL